MYYFKCHWCKAEKPKGTASYGVKPYPGAASALWLRFCAPCLQLWDVDTADDSALQAPSVSAACQHRTLGYGGSPPSTRVGGARMGGIEPLCVGGSSELEGSDGEDTGGAPRGEGGDEDEVEELEALEAEAEEEAEQAGAFQKGIPLLTKEMQRLALCEAAGEFTSGAPQVTADGSFQRPGRGAKRPMSKGEVDAWREENFLSKGAFVQTPTKRALAAKPPGGWDDDSRNYARRCFAAASTRFRVHLFELTESAALMEEPRFRKTRGDGTVGVLQCCNACMSNEHVVPTNKFSTSDESTVRTSHGQTHVEVTIGRQYTCANPLCPAVQLRCGFKDAQEKWGKGELMAPLFGYSDARAVEDRKMRHWFNTWSEGDGKGVAHTLPERLRVKYYGGALLSKGGYTAGLGADLLDTDATWREKRRLLRDAYAQEEKELSTDYLNFAKDQLLADDTKCRERRARDACWQRARNGGGSAASVAEGGARASSSVAAEGGERGAASIEVEEGGARASSSVAAEGGERGAASIEVEEGGARASSSVAAEEAHTGPWPDWATPTRGGILAAPSYANIRAYFSHAYARVKDFLMADMLSRVPGKHVSTDATYRLTGRTLGADEVGYIFAMSEDHHICRSVLRIITSKR